MWFRDDTDRVEEEGGCKEGGKRCRKEAAIDRVLLLCTFAVARAFTQLGSELTLICNAIGLT